ncbi:hypothetical protein CEXT_51341 [Caerostris extrusa]|uniref:Uncharacterized protein n=1 Tax=Caerostris extrusa TaxID=172846 RepID=A0AAV4MLD7_CAEEX|nr:hypothetical protein CEXT_51341 [Caerostris extrusa]
METSLSKHYLPPKPQIDNPICNNPLPNDIRLWKPTPVTFDNTPHLSTIVRPTPDRKHGLSPMDSLTMLEDAYVTWGCEMMPRSSSVNICYRKGGGVVSGVQYSDSHSRVIIFWSSSLAWGWWGVKAKILFDSHHISGLTAAASVDGVF